jgi:3-deoxy-manno-octulosonate cytidylyltransferase (CMP-KDO synthetase)
MSISFMQDARGRFDVGTIAAPIADEAEFLSPSVVKVVVDKHSRALYFSRSAIPHSRDGQRLEMPHLSGKCCFGYKHLGLYLFRPNALNGFINVPASQLEEIEKLEQLRILEAGESIGVLLLEPELVSGLVEVNTPEDLIRAENYALKYNFSRL